MLFLREVACILAISSVYRLSVRLCGLVARYGRLLFDDEPLRKSQTLHPKPAMRARPREVGGVKPSHAKVATCPEGSAWLGNKSLELN